MVCSKMDLSERNMIDVIWSAFVVRLFSKEWNFSHSFWSKNCILNIAWQLCKLLLLRKIMWYNWKHRSSHWMDLVVKHKCNRCKAVEQRYCTEREQWWTPCFSLSETVVRNLLSVLTGGNNSWMVLHVFVKAQWFTAAWFLQTEIKTMLAQPKRLKRHTV